MRRVGANVWPSIVMRRECTFGGALPPRADGLKRMQCCIEPRRASYKERASGPSSMTASPSGDDADAYTTGTTGWPRVTETTRSRWGCSATVRMEVTHGLLRERSIGQPAPQPVARAGDRSIPSGATQASSPGHTPRTSSSQACILAAANRRCTRVSS